jgi:prephenate dehydrogenase
MRIGVAGLGLIGGSLALALRTAHDVRGYDVDDATRAEAAARGIAVVDRLEALVPADAVVVATPLDRVVDTLAALSAIAAGAVLVDVASLRAPVNAYADQAPAGARIVGAHPMAGGTAGGFSAARTDLFQGRPFLVVPTSRSDAAAMAVAGAVGREAGGVVTVLSSAAHDRAMAHLSALPLAVAATTTMVAREGDLAFAGPGARDTTRLAMTAEPLALELLLGNADAALAIDKLVAELETLSRAVHAGDRAYLRDYLRAARDARSALG